MRTFGYPVFIIISSFGTMNLYLTVLFQQALGILSTVTLYLISKEILSNKRLSFIVALMFTLSVDILFMEVTIYAETLTIFLLMLSAYFLILALKRQSYTLWIITGIFCTLTTVTKPVFQVLIPLISMFILCRNRRFSTLAAYAIIPVIVLFTYSCYNYRMDNHFRMAIGSGFSSLNYVGHPEIYETLPTDMEYIKKIYLNHKEDLKEFRFVYWSNVVNEIMEAKKSSGVKYIDSDDESFSIFIAAVKNNPYGYFNVWLRVIKEYLTDFVVYYGLFPNYSSAANVNNVQISLFKYNIVSSLEKLYKIIQPFLSWLAILSGIVFITARRKLTAFAFSSSMAIYLMFMTYTLLSTAIESAVGQMRYRMPWQGIIIFLAFASIYTILTALFKKDSSVETEPS
ncbi:hypothetical protein MCHI_003749 [Candidatus Magnetoovum chiemensis]|nr:hypothetical protein MCHI_003749 [Candidatus Magnetoovum chiemensis]